MSQSQQSELPGQPSLSTSSAVNSSLDGLPEWCSDAFRERYRRGEVPQFGCYDPVYLRQAIQPIVPPQLKEASELPATSSTSFFPPFSSLVRQYAKENDAASSASTSKTTGDNEDAQDYLAGSAFGRARPRYSWEHITSAEDLWNGPPLTTKIPPASDYERILLNRT